MSYRADKELAPAAEQLALWGGPPPCLPPGRAPGLDARGRGVWSITEAVGHAGGLWDPFRGFRVRRAR